MSRLAAWLWKACSDLALRVELGFKLVLDDGTEVRTMARIPDLGAPNGMLVFISYDDVRNCSRQLVDAGYGYSVLDEPSPNEKFDLDSFRSMFADWGWSGELGRKPAWMR